jgi:competence protein ComEC
MDSPELIILDVGHGNCTIVRDINGVIVIDCPIGITLLETLEHLAIKEISYILISHADADHIAGVTTLLLQENIRIHNVCVNPDASKTSEAWYDFRIALEDAQKRFKTEISKLTTAESGKFPIGSINLEVLAPTYQLLLGGAGGTDLKKRKLNSNSISAVIGIIHDNHRVAVLAGDIDSIGFENLLESISSCPADILVFPHHGGNPGSGNSQTFAARICSFIQPKLIIFSIDRNRFNNPRKEIIEGLRFSVPDAHILCTQLSQQCAANTPSLNPAHLNTLPARGSINNSCCGGTIVIKIDGSRTKYTEMPLHKQFILSQVTSPLCQKSLPLVPSQIPP